MSDKLDVRIDPEITKELEKSPDGSIAKSKDSDGKISKIVDTARSVTEELAKVVDLKVKLVQTEAEERINEKVNHLIQKSLGMLLYGMVALMFLIGIALLIGEYFDSSGLGFLSVGAFILLVTLVLRSFKPNWFKWQMNRVDIAGLLAAKSNITNGEDGND